MHFVIHLLDFLSSDTHNKLRFICKVQKELNLLLNKGQHSNKRSSFPPASHFKPKG